MLFALPTLAVAGPWLPVAGPLFAFRIIVPPLLAIAIVIARQVGVDRNALRRAVILAIGWVVVGAALGARAGNRELALRALLSVGIGLCCIVILTLVARFQRGLRAFECGWIVALAVALIPGLVEITTDNHLPGYLSAYEPGRVMPRMPASFFGNPNNLAAFIILSAPTLARWGSRGRSWRRWLAIVLGVASYVTVCFTGSRIALAGLALGVAAAPLAWHRPRFLIASLPAAAAVVLLAGVPSLLFQAADSSPGASAQKAQYNPSSIVEDMSDPTATSAAGSRLEVYRRALHMAVESRGLGVGPGQFAPQIEAMNKTEGFTTVSAPHNLYLQILAEYGVLLFLLVLWWLGSVLVAGFRRAAPTHPPGVRSRAATAAVTLTILSLASLAPSDFLLGSFQWLVFGLCSALTVLPERSRRVGTP